MRPQTAETLAWVLIYSGALLVVLGLAVGALGASTEPLLKWALIAGGGLDAALGVGLIIWRSKMKETP